ncbi:MAG TPA: sigma-70 family RNA polymerase sigma factor [Acidimicrobiales bacterium]|nr:sigma-70 family RNA polymerase sigma factor [Acidimicrobiales bacterium]
MDTMAADPPLSEALVRSSTAGGASAFYRAEYPRLVAALTLYCGDQELAAELAQEAMARAWRLWGRVGSYESPAAWVHRVGINLANSALRRAALRARLTQAERPEEAAAPADIGAALALRQAVASLPRRQRTALVLRYFVDLPYEEVAELMRCRAGTVRALTAQAIENLRKTAGLQDIEEEAP